MAYRYIQKIVLAVLVLAYLPPYVSQTAAPNVSCTTSDCAYCPNTTVCLRCTEGRALIGNGKLCVMNCPDGLSKGISEINGTEMFATICINQGSNNDCSGNNTVVYIVIIVGLSTVVILIVIIKILSRLSATIRERYGKLSVNVENLNNEALVHQNEAFFDEDPDDEYDNIEDDNENLEDKDFSADADGNEILIKLQKLNSKSEALGRLTDDIKQRRKNLSDQSTAAKTYDKALKDLSTLSQWFKKPPCGSKKHAEIMLLLNRCERLLKGFGQKKGQQGTYFHKYYTDGTKTVVKM